MKKERVEKFIATLKRDAERSGYNLTPDDEFLHDLAQGLLENTDRYGYQSCPCRLSEGILDKDLDIICPCDYRDMDLNDYGYCYCALYVDEATAKGEKDIEAIPDRRKEEQKKKAQNIRKTTSFSKTTHPIWRCSVCGYLCARENPPEKCPICKAQKERFEAFLL